jgi:exodeoxyribonuclease-5
VTVLSPGQEKALDQVLSWYERLPRTWSHCNGGQSDCPKFPHTHGNGYEAPVYSLGGFAGTGKTTLMRVLDESIDGEAVFGTPTHKASSVLRKKLPPGQSARVRTYHSLVYIMSPIYRCTITNSKVSSLVEKCTCGRGDDTCECPMKFLPCGKGVAHACHVTAELRAENREHLGGHRDLVIIDESSMLSNSQVMDIVKFGVPILLVGDRNQLPPIKDPMNRWTMNPDVELTEIHRQGADSGVLMAAHDVRVKGRMTQDAYGNKRPPDVVRLAKSSPTAMALLDRFQPGMDGAVITWTNKLRATLNRTYHAKYVGGDYPGVGDRVIALGGMPYEAARVRIEDGVPRATGEFIMVHNSMSGTVLKASERGYVTEMTVQLDDHPLATEGDPVVILTGGCPLAQFGAESELPYNDPRRPKGSHLWDYGYALTAHKAQGSEWPKVIVIDQSPQSYRQWMYTSITRGQEAVVVIDWNI